MIFLYPLKKENDAYLRNVVIMIPFEKTKFLKLRMILLVVWDYMRGTKGRKF